MRWLLTLVIGTVGAALNFLVVIRDWPEPPTLNFVALLCVPGTRAGKCYRLGNGRMRKKDI